LVQTEEQVTGFSDLEIAQKLAEHVGGSILKVTKTTIVTKLYEDLGGNN